MKIRHEHKPLGTESKAKAPAGQKSKLVVRLEDLLPKQDVRAGGRVVFGQVQSNTKLNK